MQADRERRRFARLDAAVNVDYTEYATSEENKPSVSKSISNSGLCLTLNEKLHELSLLELKIKLPAEASHIDAVARVIWVQEVYTSDAPLGKKYYIGVEFVEISEAGIKKINDYISAALKKT